MYSRTYATLVIHRDQTKFEYYSEGTDASTRFLTWSISKSVTNGLIGIALREGRLSLEDRVCTYYPQYPCNLTIRHLLQWTSGLNWQETYEGLDFSESSIVQQLYGDGIFDVMKFIGRHPLLYTPGTSWSYSSGDSNVLMGILRRVFPETERDDFPWVRLFEPLGMQDVTWERDHQGVFIGSSFLFTTARDLAKFGKLYLNQGRHQGLQLIDEEFIRESLEPNPVYLKTTHPLSMDSIPGMHWWVNKPVKERNGKSPWPELPPDAFIAHGHWNQYLVVIPSLQLIVVRFGLNRGFLTKFNFRHFMKLVLKFDSG